MFFVEKTKTHIISCYIPHPLNNLIFCFLSIEHSNQSGGIRIIFINSRNIARLDDTDWIPTTKHLQHFEVALGIWAF